MASKKAYLIEKIKEELKDLEKDKTLEVTFEELKTIVRVSIIFKDREFNELAYIRFKKAMNSRSKSKYYRELALAESIIIFKKRVDKTLKDLEKLYNEIIDIKKNINKIKKECYAKVEKKICDLVEEEYNEWLERKEAYKMCKEFREALKKKEVEKIKEYLEVAWSDKSLYNVLKRYVRELINKVRVVKSWDMVLVTDGNDTKVLAVYVDKNKYEFKEYEGETVIYEYEVYLIDLINENIERIMALENRLSDYPFVYIKVSDLFKEITFKSLINEALA